LIFWLEENCNAKLLRAWQKTNGVTSPGKGKIRFDGNYMQGQCEKEQCAQNFSGLVKNELTAEHFVTKLRLESRLLGIMKATSMQALQAAKLATNEWGEVIDGK
jgi:hypothetical protein